MAILIPDFASAYRTCDTDTVVVLTFPALFSSDYTVVAFAAKAGHFLSKWLFFLFSLEYVLWASNWGQLATGRTSKFIRDHHVYWHSTKYLNNCMHSWHTYCPYNINATLRGVWIGVEWVDVSMRLNLPRMRRLRYLGVWLGGGAMLTFTRSCHACACSGHEAKQSMQTGKIQWSFWGST